MEEDGAPEDGDIPLEGEIPLGGTFGRGAAAFALSLGVGGAFPLAAEKSRK